MSKYFVAITVMFVIAAFMTVTASASANRYDAADAVKMRVWRDYGASVGRRAHISCSKPRYRRYRCHIGYFLSDTSLYQGWARVKRTGRWTYRVTAYDINW